MVRIKKDTVGIVGLSRSGLSCAKLYRYLGFKVKGFDDNYNLVIDPSYKDYFNEVFLGKQPNYVIGEIKNYKFLIVSPGVPFDHPLIMYAMEHSVPVISEIEAAYRAIKAKKSVIISVTGTNGKSTVATLIYSFIKDDNDSVYLAGNIGYPFSEAVYESLDKESLVFVLELSSFQLKMTNNFRSNIAILTNISSDHLDRHLTFEDYVQSKMKLSKMQLKKDYFISNFDDPNIVDILNNPNFNSFKSSLSGVYKKVANYSFKRSVYFSSTYSDKNEIVINRYDKEVFRFSLDNVNNYLFRYDGIYRDNLLISVLPAYIYSKFLSGKILDVEKIKGILDNFVPLDFRLKVVSKLDNIEFFNDSKATNIASVKSSIDTVNGYFNNLNTKSYAIILLMGGVLKYSCKEQAYKEVEELSLYAKDKIIGVIGFGKYGDIFTSPFAKYGVKYVYSLPRLEDAFAKSLALANLEKENFERVAILLAPGGASFDEFKSAEERGKFFDKLVENFVQCAKT